jgi:DNA primase catalytic core
MRFTDRVQGQASLALRSGDTAAAGYYADHRRLHAVTGDTGIDAVYTAWAVDRAAGHDSVMMAPTLEQVGRLNARARADRLAAAGGITGPELVTGSGDTVSAGDLIVTKKNNRWIRLGGGTDFVQNNHRFTVDAVNADGSLGVTQVGRGVRATLPADYVRDGHVRLGYAHTLAGCQGMTVGAAPGKTGPGRTGTAHALLTPGMSRNEVYPAMTRAVTANHAWIDTGSGSAGGDPHQVVKPESVSPPTISELFAAMIGRDGANRSATTETREITDPHRRLGHANDAYAHAVVAGAEHLLPPGEMEGITAAAENAVPGVTTAPAWDTLRGHLALLVATGQDPIALLTAAAAERELDTARDLAAVLDYRLDPTGNHSQGEGPLPWLPAVPAALVAREDWAPYLRARADLVTTLAQQVRTQARAWTPQTAPAWAQPYLTDRHLLGDLAVWRAAQTVDADDQRPAGPRPTRIALAHRHSKLVDRCLTVTGDPADGTHRWATALPQAGFTADHLVGDDYWPVLAARLTLADTAGLPVPALLADAAQQGPVPAEQPAAALWWRLAPHLAGLVTVTTAAGQHVRPTWTGDLTRILGAEIATRITQDPLWPTLVARVDTAAATGLDPARLVDDAAALLAATARTVRPDQYATVLLLHISTLADPAPVTPGHGTDHDVPPDPADADLQPPDDLHTTEPGHEQALVPAGRVGQGANDIAEPTDPGDEEALPLDPVAATITAAADENIDEQAALDRAAAAADAAWEYFQTQAPRSWVPGYLADRRLDTLVAGYAPSGDRLIRDLHQQGYTDDELLAAGLAKADTRTGRLASRFHNRLMLPIHDTTGRVVAFIGRTHPNQAGDPPKYLNTPTTGLFRKHQLPYGLTPGALDRYRAGADLVIVEGPTDTHAVTTAAADQTTAGRPAPVVIAPLGTALTAGHLATLDDIAPLADRQVLVVLDNDPAGRAAARRAHRLLLDAGITTTGTITLPDRHDPAQLHADDPRALVDALQNPQPLADLVVEDIVATWMRGVRPGDWGCVEAVNALTDVAPIIARLPPGDRARLAIRVADTTGNDLITVIDHIEAQVPGRPVDVDPLGLPTPPRLRTVPDPPGAADPETAPSLRDRIRSIGTHVADVRAEGPGRKPLAKEQLPRQAHHREPHLGW